jgi:ferredoxin
MLGSASTLHSMSAESEDVRNRLRAGKFVGAEAPRPTVPTIRFEQEGQQVGCIEGANLRKAALDAGVNPYKGLNNINNCGGVGQCGTCVMEVVEGMQNLSPRSDVEQVYLADRPANYRLSCRTSVNGDVTVRTRPQGGVGQGSNSLVGALKSLIGK